MQNYFSKLKSNHRLLKTEVEKSYCQQPFTKRNVKGTFSTRKMIPNGNPDLYKAIVPGMGNTLGNIKVFKKIIFKFH